MSDFTRYEVNTADLRTEDLFSSLLEIRPENLHAITESMKATGFDQGEPIAVWHGVVIDGHTRLKAAKAAKIRTVPCIYHDFKDEDEALEYAVHRQRDRRNWTDADMMRVAMVVDSRRTKAEAGVQGSNARWQAPDGASHDVSDSTALQNSGSPRSSTATAKILGTSPRKVERIRTVMDKATAEVKKDVLEGKKTINSAYNQTVSQGTKDAVSNQLKKPKPIEGCPSCIELKDQLREMAENFKATEEDNKSMGRVFEADDKLAAAMAEVVRFKEAARIATERLQGKMGECAQMASAAKSWKHKFEALERKFKALDRDETFQKGA